MKEIAQALGISRTTVSLVLQGRGDEYRISPETQTLVRSYVEESDFKPNYFAQALNRGKTGVIGVVFPDVFESFMSKMIRGIESALYPQGYTLSVSTTRFDRAREKAILETMVWQQVDGIIWAPTLGFRGNTTGNISSSSVLQDSSLPVVLVDRSLPLNDPNSRISVADEANSSPTFEREPGPREFPGVFQEDYAMAYKKVREVVQTQSSSTGTLVCVSFDLEASSLIDRQQGAKAVCDDWGWEYVPILLQEQDPKAGDLEHQLFLLSQIADSQPLVFFSTTAGIAEKLHWLIHSSPLSVSFNPRITSAPMIRFGESSSWMSSPFEEISQPHEAMGMVAGLWIHELINGRADNQNKQVKGSEQRTSKSLGADEIDSKIHLKSLLETCYTSYPEAREHIRISN